VFESQACYVGVACVVLGGSLVQKVCGKVQERSSPVPSTQQFSSDGNRPSLLLKAFARAARHGQLLSRQFYSLYQERHDPVSIHTQLSNTAVSLSITAYIQSASALPAPAPGSLPATMVTPEEAKIMTPDNRYDCTVRGESARAYQHVRVHEVSRPEQECCVSLL
jgi:hypothetical protein